MRPISKEEYILLTHTLDHLAIIFKRIGITEFSIVESVHSFNTSKKINPEILNRLTSAVDKLYFSLPKEAK